MYINMSPKDIPYWNPNLPYWEQSVEALLFWENEYDKIRNGVNLGGYYMNGWMYFHLNHFTADVFDLSTNSPVIRQPFFDDNVYFLMECFNKAVKEGKGFVMWGTRGFAKTTFMASHEYWTHLCRNNSGATSLVVYGGSEDVSAMESSFSGAHTRMHSAFRLNIPSGQSSWDKASEVSFGYTLTNSEKLISSRLKLINGQKGVKSASEKTAGYTPIGFKMDEIGKFDPVGVFQAAQVSFKRSGVATFTFILSGCVCAGTKVWNNKGELINIEDLDKDGGILGFNLKENKVSKEDITYWQPPHEKHCYRITTNKGKILECSEDHPILIRDRYENGVFKKGKVLFKETKDLIVGDHVCVVNGMNDEFFTGTRKMFDPYLVGMAIGDGCIQKSGAIMISNSDEDVKNYIKSKYHTNTVFSSDTKDGRLLEKFTVSGVCPKMRDLGLNGKSREFKTLPNDIYSFCKEDIIEMINGYYDADGCFYVSNSDKTSNHNRRKECLIKLTSCGRNILFEVQMLLLKFGIQSNLVYEPLTENSSEKSTRGHYNLIIKTGDSMAKFADIFSPKIGYKKEKLLQIKEIWGNVSKNKQGNYVYESVKSIEYIGIKPVYNLTAGTTNTYLANGIITHNTGGNSELSEGAKKMLTNPNDYDISIMNWELLNNMVPEEHITWKEDTGRLFSTFVPGHMSYRNNQRKDIITFGEFSKFKYKSEELNSMVFNTTNWGKANEFFYNTYNSYTDNESKNKLRMYLPRNISDTFLVDNTNSFDKDKIVQKLEEIKRQPKYELVDFEVDYQGKITKKFVDKPLAGRRYEGKYIEAPYMIFEGFPEEIPGKFHNVSGCDDYKSEDSTTDSLGSMYVLSRRSSTEPLEKIIASITERPKRHRHLYEHWEKLIRATNALCNIEIADANFVPYLEDTLKVNPGYYLHPFINPHEEQNTKRKSGSTSKYRYGVYPTTQNKSIMIQEVIDYTQTEFNAGFDPVTNMPIVKCGIDLIEDPWLLQEMLEYQPGSNVDRIVSFGWALVLARYMDRKKIVKEDLHVKKYNENVIRTKPKVKGIYGSTKRIRNF